MISYLNELEILGAEIDADSQVDMILQSLPDSFNQFKLNYTMNKNVYSLSELMNRLCAMEGILKTKGTVNLTQASTSKPKSKGKGGWKKKKKADKKGKQVALRVGKGSTQARNSKPKGKCFHCGEDGHWKRNCSKFLASKKQGMFKSLLVESCLVLNPTNSWCVDSSSTNHIYNMLQQ
jgi:hypothetical protein